MGLMMRTFVTLYFNLTWCKNYVTIFFIIIFLSKRISWKRLVVVAWFDHV